MSKDIRWTVIWLAGILVAGVWNIAFLNKPALKLVVSGFFNTIIIALLVSLFSLSLAWLVTNLSNVFEMKGFHPGNLALSFMLNLIKSIPQIVGVLVGYILVAFAVGEGHFGSTFTVFIILALIMSLFIFIELVELMKDRIAHFKRLDFYNAMKVCGIAENRIINFDILLKNSRLHIFNKLISIFGMAVFLQCSVDFIISVGLSSGVSSVNLPNTLGSLLAKIDSKQDILAIGHTLTNPGYIGNLFFGHLQGITVAFLIVFTLMSIYHISDGYAERHRL
ncbi:MAG: hypothetical protein GF398_02395 [Chitinivibrionales bacterium]|nr:hypothetical protein [Chitinivibrionales bacterium]